MGDRPTSGRTPSTNLSSGGTYRPHEGKFGIITGGSRGIGSVIADKLASQGLNLLLAYSSNSSTEPTNQHCQLLEKRHGIRCVPVQADLNTPTKSIPHIIATAKNNFSHPRSGKFQVDILINNAGVSGNKELNDAKLGPIEETQFNEMYNVNVLAPLLLTQAVAPYLPTDRSGRIVNVSSVSSTLGCEGQSIYSGTKAALEAMTRVWATELGERATVNSINPGPVWGEVYASAGKEFWAANQKWIDTAPLMHYNGEESAKAMAGDEAEKFDRLVREGMGSKRPAFNQEIAGVVSMLCSEDSGWTTGSVVSANGGLRYSIA